MSRAPRRLLALALAVGALLASAATPAAAGSARVTDVVVEQQTLRASFSVGGLPDGTKLDPSSVVVRLDGTPVGAAAVATSRAEGPASARSVVLLVDTSGSMRGARIEQARTAALAFVDAVPADVALGLTTFASEVTPRVSPGSDRAAVRAAVEGLRAQGNTLLNDGVVSAVQALGFEGSRSVVLLSDGAHDGSPTTTAEAASAVSSSGVSLSAVNVGADPAAARELAQLAEAGRGDVVLVSDGADLTAPVRAAAKQLSEQLTVTAAVPAALVGRRITVDVEVRSGTTVHAASAEIVVPGAPAVAAPPPARPAWTPVPTTQASSTLVLVAAATVFAAIALTSLLLLGPGRGRARDARSTRHLIDAYTVGARASLHAPPAQGLDGSPVAQGLLTVAGRVAERRDRSNKTARRLEQAAMTLRAPEWLLLQCGVALATGLLLALILRGGALGFLLGVALGAVATSAWLRRKAGQRRAAFMDGLPDALQLISSGLSTGYSFAQAVDAVHREGVQPVAAELGRALAEARVGVSIEDALEGVAQRMESEDMSWVVMAVRVQRDVGGNLAEVLHTVFETMRERARIRREVRTLSAEGRISALVLIALPVFMAGYQLLFRRDYMRPLYTETVGIFMLVLTVLSVLIGAAWTRKLVKVEA